jgi:hypothetical protein
MASRVYFFGFCKDAEAAFYSKCRVIITATRLDLLRDSYPALRPNQRTGGFLFARDGIDQQLP